MNSRLIFLILTGALSVSAAPDWSRYEIITQRAPFGRALPPDETVAPARPSGEFAKQYRLCMLYADAQGRLKAGLVSKTSNKNFFLQVGETEGELTITDVDIVNGTALLRKGSEMAQLTLEGLNLPAAAKVPGPSGSMQSVASAASGDIPRSSAVERSYSFLAPVTAKKQNRLSSSSQNTEGLAGVGSTASSEQTDSNVQTSGLNMASSADISPEADLKKRIIVKSSKTMPGKYAFIPR